MKRHQDQVEGDTAVSPQKSELAAESPRLGDRISGRLFSHHSVPRQPLILSPCREPRPLQVGFGYDRYQVFAFRHRYRCSRILKARSFLLLWNSGSGLRAAARTWIRLRWSIEHFALQLLESWIRSWEETRHRHGQRRELDGSAT